MRTGVVSKMLPHVRTAGFSRMVSFGIFSRSPGCPNTPNFGTMDPLTFYRGPYSARVIQGNGLYPGKNDWHLAFLYYRTAAQLCAGPCLPWIALRSEERRVGEECRSRW